MIGISSCLIGEKCRYDGKSNEVELLKQLVEIGEAIHFCPEVLGGLSTPRSPSEIKDKKVVTKDGKEVTKNFVDGANKTLEILKANDVNIVIMKSKSPSCGSGLIYDGTFSGHLTIGNGVTTQLLIDNGIEVFSENEIHELMNRLIRR